MDDLLQRFGEETEKEALVNDKIAEACLTMLAKEGLLTHADVPWSRAHEVLTQCQNTVQISQSAITTRMGRLLMGIACLHKPATVLVIGSFQGGSLLWIATGAGPESTCLGVDIDESANHIARANLHSLGLTQAVVYDCDGHDAAALFDRKIDLVLLDAESQRDGEASKTIYTTLLSALLPHLSDRALVLAHDACWPKFAADFHYFKAFATQTNAFAKPVTLAVDRYGLLVLGRANA